MFHTNRSEIFNHHTYELIKKKEMEIEILKKIIKFQNTGIEFYANKDNWTPDDMYSWSTGQTSIIGDKETLYDDGNKSDCRGGKLARKTVEEVKTLMEKL